MLSFPHRYSSLTPIKQTPQHDVPPGKHALITVKQPKGNLVWIMAGNEMLRVQSKADKEKLKPRLQIWDECDFIQARLLLNLFCSIRNDFSFVVNRIM